MLIPSAVLDSIAEGSVEAAVRRWKRPTVRAGGTLRTAIGLLAIDAVERIADDDLDEALARRCGFGSREEVVASLRPPEADRHLYVIEFHLAGDDPRIALRERVELDRDELEDVLARLGRLDRAAADEWTHRTLEIIGERPGVVARELAPLLGLEREPFKRNVRKLKNLGLTESLEVGYRLSPRGQAVLSALRDRPAP